MLISKRSVILAVAVGILLTHSVQAQSVADINRGNTVRVVNWSSPGGEYDLHGRLLARHLGRHIPGQPAVVHQTMTGAGGQTAASHIYNVAPRDGTVLGIANSGLPLYQALGAKSVQYDATRFNWIGTITPIADIMISWHTAPARSFKDLLSREFVLGTTGRNSTSWMIPTAMNALLKTKIKAVLGFRGGADVNVAIERGEIMGRINAWTGMKATKPEWIREKKVTVLVQSALISAPDLKGVPLLVELAKNEDDRAIFRMFGAGGQLGRPLMTAPDVPADRVVALRAAFAAAMTDPAFVAEAKKFRIEIMPVMGTQLQGLVAKTLSTPKPLIARLKSILGQ
jgi:tripartite-type tricarboxylate transporter receptor subunit TctC